MNSERMQSTRIVFVQPWVSSHLGATGLAVVGFEAKGAAIAVGSMLEFDLGAPDHRFSALPFAPTRHGVIARDAGIAVGLTVVGFGAKGAAIAAIAAGSMLQFALLLVPVVHRFSALPLAPVTHGVLARVAAGIVVVGFTAKGVTIAAIAAGSMLQLDIGAVMPVPVVHRFSVLPLAPVTHGVIARDAAIAAGLTVVGFAARSAVIAAGSMLQFDLCTIVPVPVVHRFSALPLAPMRHGDLVRHAAIAAGLTVVGFVGFAAQGAAIAAGSMLQFDLCTIVPVTPDHRLSALPLAPVTHGVIARDAGIAAGIVVVSFAARGVAIAVGSMLEFDLRAPDHRFSAPPLAPVTHGVLVRHTGIAAGIVVVSFAAQGAAIAAGSMLQLALLLVPVDHRLSTLPLAPMRHWVIARDAGIAAGSMLQFDICTIELVPVVHRFSALPDTFGSRRRAPRDAPAVPVRVDSGSDSGVVVGDHGERRDQPNPMPAEPHAPRRVPHLVAVRGPNADRRRRRTPTHGARARDVDLLVSPFKLETMGLESAFNTRAAGPHFPEIQGEGNPTVSRTAAADFHDAAVKKRRKKENQF
jgi:hypothetical protein